MPARRLRIKIFRPLKLPEEADRTFESFFESRQRTHLPVTVYVRAIEDEPPVVTAPGTSCDRLICLARAFVVGVR